MSLFQTLGIEPTLSQAAISRAYLARLREHPPERDPVGFARIRKAYEALRSKRGCALAFLSEPFGAGEATAVVQPRGRHLAEAFATRSLAEALNPNGLARDQRPRDHTHVGDTFGAESAVRDALG